MARAGAPAADATESMLFTRFTAFATSLGAHAAVVAGVVLMGASPDASTPSSRAGTPLWVSLEPGLAARPMTNTLQPPDSPQGSEPVARPAPATPSPAKQVVAASAAGSAASANARTTTASPVAARALESAASPPAPAVERVDASPPAPAGEEVDASPPAPAAEEVDASPSTEMVAANEPAADSTSAVASAGRARTAPPRWPGPGEVDRAARPRWPIRPAYPTRARQQGNESTVVVEAWVDDAGQVAFASVVRSGGADFDAAARRAIEQSAFRPARRAGRSVASRVALRVHFELYE